jgi:hypothetical protein
MIWFRHCLSVYLFYEMHQGTQILEVEHHPTHLFTLVYIKALDDLYKNVPLPSINCN